MKSTSILVLFAILLLNHAQAQVNQKTTVRKPTTSATQVNPINAPVLKINAGENNLLPGYGVHFTGKNPNYTIHVNEITITAGEGLQISGEYPNYKVEYKKHKVGDKYLGGVIFYVDDTGYHGLVAGEVISGNWTTYHWEYFYYKEEFLGIFEVKEEEAIIEPSDFKTLNCYLDGIGRGKYNTMNMIMNDRQDLNIVDVGEDYSITYHLKYKFPDWYIPSHSELRMLYKQRTLLPAKARTGVFWSSTEGGNVKRYKQNGPRGENLNRKYLDGYSNVKVDLGKHGVMGVKCIDFSNGLDITVAKTYDHKCILVREF